MATRSAARDRRPTRAFASRSEHAAHLALPAALLPKLWRRPLPGGAAAVGSAARRNRVNLEAHRPGRVCAGGAGRTSAPIDFAKPARRASRRARSSSARVASRSSRARSRRSGIRRSTRDRRSTLAASASRKGEASGFATAKAATRHERGGGQVAPTRSRAPPRSRRRPTATDRRSRIRAPRGRHRVPSTGAVRPALRTTNAPRAAMEAPTDRRRRAQALRGPGPPLTRSRRARRPRRCGSPARRARLGSRSAAVPWRLRWRAGRQPVILPTRKVPVASASCSRGVGLHAPNEVPHASSAPLRRPGS